MNSEKLEQLEIELKKRWELPYTWGRSQNDFWDRESRFIYNITSWEALLLKIDVVAKTNNLNREKFLNYACNRWYNFLSAQAVEAIFTSIQGVQKTQNSKDCLKDFRLHGIDFDHKTSVFPKAYLKSIEYAQQHPETLVSWLYENQSTQQRLHFENRLFLLVYAENGEHWKLKAEISWLKSIIEEYVSNFDKNRLIKMEFEKQKPVFSDIIWSVR